MSNRPYLIVIGNEKGGTGKSTTALHIAIYLMRKGHRVGTIDLDGRQKSLTRYIENRRAFAESRALDIPIPVELVVSRSDLRDVDRAEAAEKAAFEAAYAQLDHQVDFILIDCPGSDTYLSRLAHTAADTLVTPVNDSFIDLDLLAEIDQDSYRIIKPSYYTEMVFKARQRRQMADGHSIDWVILRNRVSALHARNKARVDRALDAVGKRFGARYISGLSERVIYRELFLDGLTLLDLRDAGVMRERSMSMSHVAARQELRTMMSGLRLPGLIEEAA